MGNVGLWCGLSNHLRLFNVQLKCTWVQWCGLNRYISGSKRTCFEKSPRNDPTRWLFFKLYLNGQTEGSILAFEDESIPGGTDEGMCLEKGPKIYIYSRAVTHALRSLLACRPLDRGTLVCFILKPLHRSIRPLSSVLLWTSQPLSTTFDTSCSREPPWTGYLF